MAKGAELSSAAVGIGDEPTEAVGNLKRNTNFILCSLHQFEEHFSILYFWVRAHHHRNTRFNIAASRAPAVTNRCSITGVNRST